jgi:hypothetical protein
MRDRGLRFNLAEYRFILLHSALRLRTLLALELAGTHGLLRHVRGSGTSQARMMRAEGIGHDLVDRGDDG